MKPLKKNKTGMNVVSKTNITFTAAINAIYAPAEKPVVPILSKSIPIKSLYLIQNLIASIASSTGNG